MRVNVRIAQLERGVEEQVRATPARILDHRVVPCNRLGIEPVIVSNVDLSVAVGAAGGAQDGALRTARGAGEDQGRLRPLEQEPGDLAARA